MKLKDKITFYIISALFFVVLIFSLYMGLNTTFVPDDADKAITNPPIVLNE